MANKTKKTISFSNGENVHVTFDSGGYIIKAEGFSSLLWSTDPDNLDKSLIGTHVYELSEMLKKYGAYVDAYKVFEKDVVKKVKRFAQRLS